MLSTVTRHLGDMHFRPSWSNCTVVDITNYGRYICSTFVFLCVVLWPLGDLKPQCYIVDFVKSLCNIQCYQIPGQCFSVTNHWNWPLKLVVEIPFLLIKLWSLALKRVRLVKEIRCSVGSFGWYSCLWWVFMVLFSHGSIQQWNTVVIILNKTEN